MKEIKIRGQTTGSQIGCFCKKTLLISKRDLTCTSVGIVVYEVDK